MPPILNANAVVTCCHGAGMVQIIPKQSTVLVGGAPALRAGDIAGNPVAGCPVVPSPASKPCTTATVPPVPGVSASTRVLIGGMPAAIGSPVVPAFTDGAPVPCPIVNVVSPGQAQVSAT